MANGYGWVWRIDRYAVIDCLGFGPRLAIDPSSEALMQAVAISNRY